MLREYRAIRMQGGQETTGRPLALIRLTNAGSCPSRQRDCVAEPIRLANAAAPLLLRSQARRKAYRARSAETQGTARYGSASWQVNAPLHDGCAGERGAGTGGWPARGDASVPLPRRTAPAPTQLAGALQKTYP